MRHVNVIERAGARYRDVNLATKTTPVWRRNITVEVFALSGWFLQVTTRTVTERAHVDHR